MFPLLRDPRVVDHPGDYWRVPLELRQRVVSSHRQYCALVPRRTRDKMVHRLMPCTHVARVDPCRHRLYALALSRQQQPRHVCMQRLVPIGVPDRITQLLHVFLEPLLPTRLQPCHAPILTRSSGNCNL